MALNVKTLETIQFQIFAGGQSGSLTQEQIAEPTAAAIDKYIKSATVTVTTIVTTADGPAAQTGTGIGNGVIS